MRKSSNDKIEKILNNDTFLPFVSYVHTLPASEGVYAPLPADLRPELRRALLGHGISELYSHQAAAWNEVRAGRHTVIVTPTASGKTLCYNLPVMQTLLEQKEARALYLFPTKALSQDQQAELNEIVLAPKAKASYASSSPSASDVSGADDTAANEGGSAGDGGDDSAAYEPLPLKIATYDGDTPQSLRLSARDTGRIIISNPDMLHSGILPNHPKWIRFFSNLKYIVVDEMHTYRGVFGSHMANLIRRLRRIARFYGSDPAFIFCSATIGNPAELAEALLGEPVSLVDKSGAPTGEKTVVLYNPPLVDSVQGIRRSVMMEGQRWALEFLKSGIKTILFAHSRVRTEVIASYINDSLKNIYTANNGIRVEPYRGGLLPNERREIEKGLRSGAIQGVVSTNALELGIDVGGLDAAVIAGFPGSFSSFWQQAGRAGRRSSASVIVFIASASPLDQYILANPRYFFDRPPEEAHIDPENPYVLTDHVKCAAFELPFTDAEASLARPGFFGPAASDVLSFLQEGGMLRHTAGRWHWSDRSFPAEGISMRSATADNIVIIDVTKGNNRVIGEMDRPSAKELIFPNAVYIHLGRQYLVKDLDVQNRKCTVCEAEVNYFTDAVVKTDIQVLSEDDTVCFLDPSAAASAPLFSAVTGDLLIRTQAAKFKKLRFHTHENIGFGEISVPPEEMESRGTILVFESGGDENGADENAGDYLLRIEREFPAAEGDLMASAQILFGVGDLMRSVIPFVLLCDRRDIGIASRVRDPHFGCPSLYVYDQCPGGSGLSEALTDKLLFVLGMCRDALASCPCSGGCPSCIGAEIGSPVIKKSTLEFLDILLKAAARERV